MLIRDLITVVATQPVYMLSHLACLQFHGYGHRASLQKAKSIERFHVMLRPPCWYTKTKEFQLHFL